MKKTLLLTLILCLSLLLCACGGTPAAPAAAAEPTAAPAAPAEPAAPAATAEPAPETAAPAEEDDTAEKIELVRSLIGQPVAELYAALGEPESVGEYTASCLVQDAEDGMIYYDGFIVYTLRSADGETVYDVE